MSLKDRISSPLEAGPSILDGHNLPTHLNSALEYASKRLARKAAHLTLVVVRHDYQLPSSVLSPLSSAGTLASPPSAASSVPVSAASTPARPAFNLATIKNLVWSNTPQPSEGTQERHVPIALDLQRNGMVSPAFSVSSMSSASTASMSSAADSTFSFGPRLRWPLSPTTPSSLSMPMTPATPFTIGSSTATTTDAGSAMSGVAGPQYPDPFGIRLVHVSPLSTREERLLKHSIEKAGRRFRIGNNWLPSPLSPSAYGLNVNLMHRSLAQNEVLFSSEGLTLLSLDHLYTFKVALASYAHTQSPRRLEDAVDELRRLVLSQGRQKLRKSALLGAYAWLGPVSDGALRDVSRMYARAYGGDAGQGGVEDDVDGDAFTGDASPADDDDDDYDDGEHPASWRFPHRPTTVVVHHHLNEKPLPALPTDSDKPDEPDEPSSGSRSRSGSSSTTRSRRSCRELEKRFCIDFDFDMEIEEYYRERAREMQAEEEAAAAAAAAAEAEAALLEEMRRTTPKISPPPPPKMPVLRLQTTFERRPTGVLKPVPLKMAAGAEGAEGAASGSGEAEVEMAGGGAVEAPGQQEEEEEEEEEPREEEEEEELTARPKSGHPNTLAASLGRWNSMTIDEIINDMESKRTSDAGPMTPNGYDDISPITRGEWGFLMVSDGWKGKTAAVEMC